MFAGLVPLARLEVELGQVSMSDELIGIQFQGEPKRFNGFGALSAFEQRDAQPPIDVCPIRIVPEFTYRVRQQRHTVLPDANLLNGQRRAQGRGKPCNHSGCPNLRARLNRFGERARRQ